jgi:hypothetical protein
MKQHGLKPLLELRAQECKMHTLESQQQALLQALLSPRTQRLDQPLPEGLQAFMAHVPGASSARGLHCYQSNAHAMAQRALCAAYPVVTAILSTDSMGQLARALWHGHPPERGDLALWGADLATFMLASPQLEGVPWLADVAQLEWALHQAEGAADVMTDHASLALLGTANPDTVTLRLAPGLKVLKSPHRVMPVLLAHRQPTGLAQTTAIEQLGEDWCPAGTEHAVVWRVGHQPPQLRAATQEEFAFLSHLLTGQGLLSALEACDLDLSSWLPLALQQSLVLGINACQLGASTNTRA